MSIGQTRSLHDDSEEVCETHGSSLENDFVLVYQ